MMDFTDGRDGKVGREGRANAPIAPFERVKLPLSKPSNLGFSNLGFSGVNRYPQVWSGQDMQHPSVTPRSALPGSRHNTGMRTLPEKA